MCELIYVTLTCKCKVNCLEIVSHPIRRADSKKKKQKRLVGMRTKLFHCRCGCKRRQALWKPVWSCFKGIKNWSTMSLTPNTLGCVSKGLEVNNHIDNRSSRFIASLFITARALNEPTLKRYIKCTYTFRSRFYECINMEHLSSPSHCSLLSPPPTLQSISLRQVVFLILSCLASTFDRQLVISGFLCLAYFA